MASGLEDAVPFLEGREGGLGFRNFRLARGSGSLGKREPTTAEPLLQTKVYPVLTESSAELHVHACPHFTDEGRSPIQVKRFARGPGAGGSE